MKWLLLPLAFIRPCVFLAQRRIHTGIDIIFFLIHSVTWQGSVIFGLGKLQLLYSADGFSFIQVNIKTKSYDDSPEIRQSIKKSHTFKNELILPYLSTMLTTNSKTRTDVICTCIWSTQVPIRKFQKRSLLISFILHVESDTTSKRYNTRFEASADHIQ